MYLSNSRYHNRPARSNQTNTTLRGNHENSKQKNDRICSEAEAAVKHRNGTIY